MRDDTRMSDVACTDSTHDPSGVAFTDLTPARLRERRTSIKWTRYDADVLPLFVAEMDYTVAPVILDTISARVAASDFGYLDAPGPLAPAFAEFARDRWGWRVDPDTVHLATDVSAGIVEALRLVLPNSGGRVALTTPVYPSFFEMLEELSVDIIEIPLGDDGIDLVALEQAFIGDAGVDAFLLCNPHNPHGIVHSAKTLTRVAEIAAQHNVLVVSDEIHAPLTHHSETFVPFAPLAREAGTLAVVATSASKGWNIAGTKCSILVAPDDRAQALLTHLPPEVACRASIIGLHASVAAFTEGRAWLDRAIDLVTENLRLLEILAAQHLPGVRVTSPRAGYLAWLDFTDVGLEDPHAEILGHARVALRNGAAFGTGGEGHIRINLACAPATLREAIRRIAVLVEGQAT